MHSGDFHAGCATVACCVLLLMKALVLQYRIDPFANYT